MRWAWKIARIADVDIRIHATFLLLLVWIGAIHYMATRTWQGAASGVLFILAVFVTVVMHELGHAITAHRFGIRTFDITLLPIGGVARLERIPERPRQEFLMAIAGPAVNLALAALLFLGLWVLKAPSAFFTRLAWVNLSLACFNLLPAFPMDGGRALRAALSTRISHGAATQVAARLGKGIALILGAIGLFFNPILLLIAVFVWTAGTAEASATRFKSALEGIPVAQAMVTEFQTLAPEDPLAIPMGRSLHGFQHDFPVCQEGRMIGLLTHAGMLEALAKEGENAPVSRAMDARFESAAPEEPLSDVLPRFHAQGGRTLPVVQNFQVVGLLTAENFGELIAQRAGHRA